MSTERPINSLDRFRLQQLGPRAAAEITAASGQRTERMTRLLEWRPAGGNSSLLGKATIRFAGGWIVAAVPIFRRADGSLSAGTPDAPLVGPDGVQLVDDAGKRRYGKLISFDGAEARRRWNDAVLDAVTAAGIAKGGNT